MGLTVKLRRRFTMRQIVLILLALIGAAGCQVIPGTGNSSTDAAAAQNFVPASIPGYNASDATDVADALSKAGVSVGLLSGNIAAAGLVGKLNDMIACYKSVGAVAARVYTEQNFPAAGIPKIGFVAVVNTTRIQSNFLQCAINIGQNSAQAVGEPQPCASSGEFHVNNETLDYLFAATSPELCTIFQQSFAGRS
jgi:hypothetical protein